MQSIVNCVTKAWLLHIYFVCFSRGARVSTGCIYVVSAGHISPFLGEEGTMRFSSPVPEQKLGRVNVSPICCGLRRLISLPTSIAARVLDEMEKGCGVMAPCSRQASSNC